MSAILGMLEPTYGKNLPKRDGWGHEMRYSSDGESYELRSLGAFGVAGPAYSGAVRDYADDLVMRNGALMSWPDGKCTGTGTVPPGGPTGATGPTELPPPTNVPGIIDLRHEKRR